ncbi:MAG: fasciclin domain-containing protein [Lacipirellulaceae bacterium]
MPRLLFAALFLAAAPAFACDTCGCKAGKDDDHAAAHAAGEAHTHTIVETAVEAGDFATLVAAVNAADLAETLSGEGPFTVFAPNDAAFAKLPADALASLLKPDAKEKLAGILTFHVVPGKVLAADVVGLTEAETVNGKKLAISVVDGEVTVSGAKVIATDIECSNGVIHVIDSVMMP